MKCLHKNTTNVCWKLQNTNEIANKKKTYMNGEIYYAHRLGENLLQWTFSPDWVIDSVQFQIKSQHSLFVEIYKLIQKFIWKNKNTEIVKTILKKKVEEFLLLDFKTYYKLRVIKAIWYWEKYKSRDKWRNWVKI